MQVTPVSAIHALRIRQKPVETQTLQTENAAATTRQFADLPMVPAHIASAALRDTHQSAHAEYATQLLASHESYPETELERQHHVQQYASATAYEDDERTYTLSLSA